MQKSVENQVPAGYKQSELGIIPEDWSAVSITETVKNIIDYRGRTPRKLGMEWGGGNITALSAGNVKKGYIDFDVECYFGSEDLYNSWMKSGHCKKNDLLFTLEAPLGNAALIPDNNKYIMSQRTVLLQFDRIRFEPRFFYQVFMSDAFFDRISNSATGSTAQGIKRTTFEKIRLATPKSIKEQTAIANALSDIDALIAEQEKLIAKKQAIKTATMQQLLTGKSRLPQFAYHPDGSAKGHKPSELGEVPEDWQVIQLGEALKICHGKNQKQVENSNGNYPILGSGGRIGWATEFLYDQPSVLIGRKGTIDNPLFMDSPFWSVDTLFYSRIFKGFSPKFLFYKFKMLDWRQYNEASGVPSLSARTIESVFISAPNEQEQSAIATILTDMDSEIEALQQRLTKTRQIKQGMMQELLTGKTRLPFIDHEIAGESNQPG